MRRRTRAITTWLFGAAVVFMCPRAAAAQVQMSECKKQQEFRSENPTLKRELLATEPPTAERPWVTHGNVVIVCDEAQLFADAIEYYQEAHVLKASGHVSFIDGAQRITAERLEFNTQTKLGTFFKAQGIMTIAGKADPKSMFGTTEADAYFYADVIDKIGPDKYRMHGGNFTTCVQPTPRWDFVGTSMTLVKDKHAVMRNAVLRVKNVPVLYLPWFYYPINKENRATGFLMPSYGHSTTRGQMFSEGFFWAINRSMDATLNYEFSSKVGIGYGGEYRYIQAPGSDGTAKITVFNGKDATGSLLTSRSIDMIASMTQRLSSRWLLRGNVNYSNDLTARQLFQQDISVSTNSTRFAGANLQGSVGKIRLTGEAAITDYFRGTTPGARTGTAPRVTAEWPSAPIGRTRIYFGMAGDVSELVRQDNLDDPSTNRNLLRTDMYPNLRAPIGSLPYLNITGTMGLRFTYWSEQLNTQGLQVPGALHRELLDASLAFRGPSFSRIFDTPNSGYATRWKHVIEPSFTISKKSSFDGFSKVPKNDSVDNEVGGTTNLTYGLSNLLLAKRPAPGGGPAVGQTIVAVQMQQTYYSNATAALYDTNYRGTGAVGSFSPLSLTTTVSPSTLFNTQGGVEYDTKYHAVRTTSIGAGVQGKRLTASANWSKQFFIKDLAGFNNTATLYHALNTSASFHTSDNHVRGTWSWSYDFRNGHQLQDRVIMSYMSQCCGVAVEYQTYYLGNFNVNGLSQDRRFNLSFSLAGIGTFSNLLGSFSR